MSDINENEQTCSWDMSDESPEMELCCCYVEMDDGTYENPCAQEFEECCC